MTTTDQRERTRERVRRWRAANPGRNRETQRRFLAANPESTRESRRKYQPAQAEKARQALVVHQEAMNSVKRALGCRDCGTRKGELQFHHVDPKTKLFSIAHAAQRSPEALDAELAKCIVLCASCHTKHHHRESGH